MGLTKLEGVTIVIYYLVFVAKSSPGDIITIHSFKPTPRLLASPFTPLYITRILVYWTTR